VTHDTIVQIKALLYGKPAQYDFDIIQQHYCFFTAAREEQATRNDSAAAYAKKVFEQHGNFG
jgi:hypothetical protein